MPSTINNGVENKYRSTERKQYMLASLAQDVLAAPASTERAFSHCGDLTKGKCNRKKVTLERSVFLKINRKLFQTIWAE